MDIRNYIILLYVQFKLYNEVANFFKNYIIYIIFII